MSGRAVLFDLDGTLVDLDVDIVGVRARLTEVFAPLGYDGAFSPVLLAIAEAAEQCAAGDAAERDALIRRGYQLIDEAEEEAAVAARPRPGAIEAWAALAASGCQLGIVTDNGGACVVPALAAAGIRPAPAVVVSRDDVAGPKPDPAGVLHAARALLPAGGRLWYVGDSVRDLAAGRAAREQLDATELSVIAVSGGRSGDDELAAAGPDERVLTLADLPALLGV